MRRLALALVLLLAQTICAMAEERAESFQCDLTLQADGTLRVAEAIDITAEGIEIKRGILRTFVIPLDVTVESVRRDGAAEPYRVTDANGLRELRIGQADVFLTHGLHHYDIVYRLKTPLTRLPNGDMLFYPVTGAWKFPFQKAGVTVALPEGAIIANAYAAIRPTGGPERTIATTPLSGNRFKAETDARLEPGDIFSIAVLWQKGIVAEEKKAP